MRFIPVPDRAREQRPLAISKVILPPDGDPTNDIIRSLEVLISDAGQWGRMLHMYCVLESGDLETILSGGIIEFTMFGEHLHPVAVQVY